MTPRPLPPSASPPASAASAAAAPGGHGHRSAGGDSTWSAARAAAVHAGRPPAPVTRRLADAVGQVLAAPLEALTDLPAFDTAAMDGWAVGGAGPWRLTGQVLAGGQAEGRLPQGCAVAIATGAAVPPGTTAVLRREHGELRPDPAGDRTDGAGSERLHMLGSHPAPRRRQDIRPQGQECTVGDRLLEAGTVVTPAVVGLAAAAGYDEVLVVPRPRVELLVLGDELLRDGLPRDGRVRDALGPMLPPWLRELGAEVTGPRWLRDDADALLRAVAGSTADLIVTTGGTAGGPVDFVHPVLERLGAALPVDGVAVRPGHPMVLAVLPGGRPLVGLPGNPLAAVSGMLTLTVPLLHRMSGRPEPARETARLVRDLTGHPSDTRLVPIRRHGRDGAAPLSFHGPAMLRGFAEADAMAVVPPGGLRKGEEAEVLTSLPARPR